MFWYDHGMNGWGYAWMGLGMVVFWALLIGGLVLVVRLVAGDRDRSPWPPGPTAEQLLAQRFARGEIDEREFAGRIAALREHNPS
ncbi:SHOCT domain-containing protein [Nocardia inohanensis]|uniref:SHOCT domain-containing protein n=1 Tax=Nocardia inohanensis TaxID=209246 RepID=UPI000A46BDF4